MIDEDGELYFTTTTPKAEVVSTITVSDAKTTTGNVVSLNATYDITAFAKRSEYENSEPATATLHWMSGTMDIATGTQEFDAKRAILVSSNDGFVTVSGLNDGEKIEVYSTDGKLLNTVYAAGNAASIAAKVGETIILNVGNETIKTIVK